MYDGIALERHGVPAVVVCTELFEPTAKQMAAMQGVSDFPMVLIAHPLGRCPVDELERKAERAVDAIAAYLLDETYAAAANDATAPTETGAVAELFGAFATSLEADGFQLLVEDASPSEVHVALVATDAACHDCLVPDAMMIDMLEAAVRPKYPNARVALEKRNFG